MWRWNDDSTIALEKGKADIFGHFDAQTTSLTLFYSLSLNVMQIVWRACAPIKRQVFTYRCQQLSLQSKNNQRREIEFIVLESCKLLTKISLFIQYISYTKIIDNEAFIRSNNFSWLWEFYNPNSYQVKHNHCNY